MKQSLKSEKEQMVFLIDSKLSLLLALIIIAVFPLPAQESEVPRKRTNPGIENPAFPYTQPEEVGLSTEKLNQLGDEITEWIANGELVGGELLIIKDGKAVFHEAYGWADREDRRPINRGSIFSIQSMSKSFTATAILMLMEKGMLSLNDPVNKYIPSFPDDSTTIHHLLSHTSGFYAMEKSTYSNPDNFKSLSEWVEKLVTDEKKKPLGTFGYTDYNYIYLGEIVHKVTGLTIDSFIEEHILRPLKMKETFTSYEPDVIWAKRMNSRYRWNDDGRVYRRVWSHQNDQPWPFYPSSHGLYTTAMDYATFITMWLDKGRWNGNRFLSEAIVEKALSIHGNADPSRGYGYGWVVRKAPRSGGMPHIFYHGGGDGTYGAAFPASDAIVIFFTQTRSREIENALSNRLGMLEIFDIPGPYTNNLLWAGDQDVAEKILTAEERPLYVGTYRGGGPGSDGGLDNVILVYEQGEHLNFRIGELGDSADHHLHLVPLGEHRFALGRYRGGHLESIDPYDRIQFILESGKVTGLEIAAGDEIQISAQRTDPDLVLSDIEFERNRVSIDNIILKILEKNGIDLAREQYRTLQSSKPDSVRFGESLLGNLGYELLKEKRVEEAIAVFEMNLESFPKSPRAHVAVGDGYRAAARLEEAKNNYKQAVELAEQQKHENLETYREMLRQVMKQLEEK